MSHDTALYFLNIKMDKLNSKSMKLLKSLVFYVLPNIKKNLIIEVYFDDSVQIEYSLIQKLLWNGYNLVILLSNNFLV